MNSDAFAARGFRYLRCAVRPADGPGHVTLPIEKGPMSSGRKNTFLRGGRLTHAHKEAFLPGNRHHIATEKKKKKSP